MENNLNATCSICGVRYHVCRDCSNTKSFTPWKTIVHDHNCYKIFLVVKDYTDGLQNKEQTKERLKAYDLSELDSFQDNIKIVIKEILKEQKIKKSKTTEIIDEVVENDNE